MKLFMMKHSDSRPKQTAETLDDAVAYDDASDQLWTIYNEEAAREDLALAEDWKGSMDSILIFAGLFSAVVTAFIVESYKTLRQDSGDMTVLLLTQIASQLSTNGVMNDSSSAFTPTKQDENVNIFWLLSLVFSLASALMATMAQQWGRYYIQSTRRLTNPRETAKVRAFLNLGIRNSHAQTIVESIPTLIHVSLVLFFIGLLQFAWKLNFHLFLAVAFGVGLFLVSYLVITAGPFMRANLPFSSPLSKPLWTALYKLRALVVWDGEEWQRPQSRLSTYQRAACDQVSVAQDLRDEGAITWTLSNIRTNDRLQAYISALPAALRHKETAETIMRIIDKSRPGEFSQRIQGLLRTCTAPHSLSVHEHRNRVKICLDAIMALSTVSVKDPHQHPFIRQILSTATIDSLNAYALNPDFCVHAVTVAQVVQSGLLWDVLRFAQERINLSKLALGRAVEDTSSLYRGRVQEKHMPPIMSNGKFADGKPRFRRVGGTERLRGQTEQSLKDLCKVWTRPRTVSTLEEKTRVELAELVSNIPISLKSYAETNEITLANVEMDLRHYIVQARYVCLITLLDSILAQSVPYHDEWVTEIIQHLATPPELNSGKTDSARQRLQAEPIVGLTFVKICQLCIMDQCQSSPLLGSGALACVIELLKNLHHPEVVVATLRMIRSLKSEVAIMSAGATEPGRLALPSRALQHLEKDFLGRPTFGRYET